jgi:hypothetical protein
MVMADMVRKDDNTSGFHTVVPEFLPYNIGKIRREKNQARRTEELARVTPPRKIVLVKRRTQDEAPPNANAAGIGALPVKADPQVKYTFKEHAAWKPEDTVDLLTLQQAKAVHAYLQKLFGAL